MTRRPNHRRPPQRRTRQRDAIRQAIEQAPGPVSPKEILAIAKLRARSLGLATVYRTLALMVNAGEVTSVEIHGEGPRYEVPKGHHHHFICRACRKVFELDGCCGHFSELTPNGFKLEGHELTLTGLCRSCVKHA